MGLRVTWNRFETIAEYRKAVEACRKSGALTAAEAAVATGNLDEAVALLRLRCNRLQARRRELREQTEESWRRAGTMWRLGDMRGWRDWTNEAERLAEQLTEVTEEYDLLSGGLGGGAEW